MKGGINKLIRNITATSVKGDFEKVTITSILNRLTAKLIVETTEGNIPHGFEGAQGEACDL